MHLFLICVIVYPVRFNILFHIGYAEVKRLDNNYEYENSLLSPQSRDKKKKKDQPCPHLPGTLLRIFIPAGAVINLLNLIEVTTPSGICLIVRIPLLGDNQEKNNTAFSLSNIVSAIEELGGTVEVMGS
jgi:hypothetical protein